MRPPNQSERGAAGHDTPNSKPLPYTANSTETIREYQAEKLRRFYCFCHATACTIAALAFAGGPR